MNIKKYYKMESGIVIRMIGGNGSNMILFPSLFREQLDRAKDLAVGPK